MSIKKIADCAPVSGKYPARAFVVCKTQEELDHALRSFVDMGHRSLIGDGYEVGKGKIVWIGQTLMQWGELKIFPNTESKRNLLRSRGYVEVQP